jgi:hypothetical protein
MKKIVYSIMAIASFSMVSCGGATTEGTEAKADSVVAPTIDGTYTLAEGSSIVGMQNITMILLTFTQVN